MAIKPEDIERIKEAVSIKEVVEDYVQLKRVGANYKGLSPFQNERTPSFYIKPTENFFKDFSSGKGGDAITFVMEIEGLSYPEALRHLARKYNIDIAEDENYNAEEAQAARNQRESILAVLEFAANYFKKQLARHPEGQSVAMTYFNERGFRPTTLEQFKLGYATPEWDGLLSAAQRAGFKKEYLELAGLIITKEETDKAFDRFRNRVMFPIEDVNGRIIAFGGRIIGQDKKQAKYINSPETPVYHKSNVVYGLYQAKKAIRQHNRVYLTEGYTDVISLHQAGIDNVVSTSGTALTPGQIKLVARFTKNFTVLYDGDVAGIKASLRGIDLLLEQGINVRAIVLPQGEDPDSYVQKIGAAEFKSFVEDNAKDFLAFKTEILLADTQDDPYQMAHLIQEVVSSIVKIPDPVTRSVFYKQTAQKLNVEEQLLVSEGNKLLIKQQRKKPEDNDTAGQTHPNTSTNPEPLPQVNTTTGLQYLLTKHETETVRLLVLYGNIVFEEGGTFANYMLSELNDIEWTTPALKTIVELYQSQLQNNQMPTTGSLMELATEDAKAALLDMAFEKYQLSKNWSERHEIYIPTEEDLLDQISHQCILRLKALYIKNRITENLTQMAQAEANNQTDIVTDCQIEHMRLKSLERQVAQHLGTVVTGFKINKPKP